jgi:hypothetical protein
MKKRIKLIIAIAVIIAAILILYFGVYQNFGPKASTGAKTYTLEVVNDQGETKSYEGRTDAEFLSGIMDELQAEGNFSYEGTDGDYGLYINTVNGLTADYDKDGAYWSIMVNGDYGQYGADSQPVADGDDYQLVYTTGEQ